MVVTSLICCKVYKQHLASLKWKAKRNVHITRMVFWQSFWYMMAFLVTLPFLLLSYYFKFHTERHFAIFVLAALVAPSQGSMNAFVYFQRLGRRKKKEESLSLLDKVLLWYRSRLSRCSPGKACRSDETNIAHELGHATGPPTPGATCIEPNSIEADGNVDVEAIDSSEDALDDSQERGIKRMASPGKYNSVAKASVSSSQLEHDGLIPRDASSEDYGESELFSGVAEHWKIVEDTPLENLDWQPESSGRRPKLLKMKESWLSRTLRGAFSTRTMDHENKNHDVEIPETETVRPVAKSAVTLGGSNHKDKRDEPETAGGIAVGSWRTI